MPGHKIGNFVSRLFIHLVTMSTKKTELLYRAAGLETKPQSSKDKWEALCSNVATKDHSIRHLGTSNDVGRNNHWQHNELNSTNDSKEHRKLMYEGW